MRLSGSLGDVVGSLTSMSGMSHLSIRGDIHRLIDPYLDLHIAYT